MKEPLIDQISKDLLIPEDRLEYLILSAPYRYKVYSIPKKSKKGTRIIAQPAKEVKRLQYWVIENIFPKFTVHESASAYIKGKNILQNASVHKTKPYLLKLDFKEFFPSIKAKDFYSYTQTVENLDIDENDIQRLVKILFWLPKPRDKNELQLSIGAPSSPRLSNILLNAFDTLVTEFCVSNSITYTRYADDLTFSMEQKDQRSIVHDKVNEILANLPSLRLELNQKKTVYGSKAHRRIVTGLIISNNGAPSLGRNKKRLIRSKIDYFFKQKLSHKEIQALCGLMAFAKSVDPEFFERMERRYGSNLLKVLNKHESHKNQ